MNWNDAINAFEQAETSFTNASGSQAAAQGKFDAAKAALDQANTDKQAAAVALNASIDSAIEALTAAKV